MYLTHYNTTLQPQLRTRIRTMERKFVMRIELNDGLLPGNRTPKHVLVTTDGAMYLFAGKSIPSVCASRVVAYEKSGKWSNTTYAVTLAPGVRYVNATRELHQKTSVLLGGTWASAAEFFGVPEAVAREFVARVWPGAARRFDEFEEDIAGVS